jgi:uncharacterized protein with ParB-like and HNH nuclease domain
MQAHENRLRQLLDSTQQYIVPLFQRFYVWERNYWDTLWDDLVDLIEDDDPQRNHFLVSVVVIPATDSAPGLPRFILIDGQQRIATLLVMLAVLRDGARQADDTELAAEIEQRFLVNQFKHGDDAYKLLLSQSDRIAFQHLIQAKTPRPEHRLCQCYDFYAKKVNAPHAPDRRALLSATMDRLALVTITLAPTDNPYLVFESLNFKGHQLTEADLIRNYLFMRIPTDQQEAIYQQYWLPMQDALGDDLTEYVRHFLMRSGAFVKQSEVYVTLKNRLAQSDARAALQELATFARYYAKLLSPGQEPSKTLSAALERINRLDVTTVYPFLLNVYHDYDRRALSEAAYVEVLATLENYLVRRFVCGLATNQLNKIFPPLYAQTQQQNTAGFVPALRQSLQTKGYPSDAQFRAKLREVKLYGRGALEQKARFLLETLEHSYRHREPVEFATLTIEHVMPQTLTDEWRSHLGVEWQTTHELYLHTLGNLTLTGYNSPLSNNQFADKCQQFAKSHVELNHYFKKVEHWRKEDILQRAAVLTEQALQCWPYFGDTAAAISDGDDVTGTKPESVTVLGTTHLVKNWRGVLTQTLETLATAEPAKFAQVLEKYPHYIAASPQGFRGPKPFGADYFIETNLAASSIVRFCQRAVATMGLPPDAWTVQVKPVIANAE